MPDISLPFTASAYPVYSISCVASRLSYKTKFVSFSSDQFITDQGQLVYLLYWFGSCLSWLSLDLPNSLCLLFKRNWKEVSTTDICPASPVPKLDLPSMTISCDLHKTVGIMTLNPSSVGAFYHAPHASKRYNSFCFCAKQIDCRSEFILFQYV